MSRSVRLPGSTDVIAALLLGVTCAVTYVLLVNVVGPLVHEPAASSEIGGMWAVAASVFVFRASLADGLADARTRIGATFMSVVVCLAYLLLFPVTPVGIGVVIAIGSLLAVVLGRPQDASLTGITSIVVLVVADLGRPFPPWVQPILRLVDTAIGVGVGLLGAALVASIIHSMKGRVHGHR
jgi:uncharacterized membrane protein YccC